MSKFNIQEAERLSGYRVDRQPKSALDLAEQDGLLAGKVVYDPKRGSFVAPEDGSPDLYLDRQQMRRLMHGDRVLVRVGSGSRGKRREAELVRLLERKIRTLAGRFYCNAAGARVEPLGKQIVHHLTVPAHEMAGAEDGQLVVAEMLSRPSQQGNLQARVLRVLGDRLEKVQAVQAAIYNHQLPHEFSEPVLQEAKVFPTCPDQAQQSGRMDLTHLPFVTIDGEDARDFDDAVFAERCAGGHRLLVAIADVAAYVKPGSELDKAARQRGTSVYFPHLVIPMLPEALSSGLCSLNPDTERLVLVSEMTISDAGRIGTCVFYEAVIRSHGRFTYTQVHEWMQEGFASAGSLASHLPELQEVFEVLRSARERRGALDLDSQQVRLEFDDDGQVTGILSEDRNDAHLMIEECMLAANLCAARFLRTHKVPSLRRVHERPDMARVESLREFLNCRGLDLPGGELPTPMDYQKVIDEVRGKPYGRTIQIMLLRSMNKAVYRLENPGHFGLNYEEYTHFTSPIRRYPDLLVHRAIKAVIHSGEPSPQVQSVAETRVPREVNYPYGPEDIRVLGEHCSSTERRADDASLQASRWLKCQYMEQRLGEDYAGVISSVFVHGLYVQITEYQVDGLVHVSKLGKDRYHFESRAQELVGKTGGRVFRIGDSVRVQVARVNVDRSRIDLELLGHQSSGTAGNSRKQAAGRSAFRKGRHGSGHRRNRRRI